MKRKRRIKVGQVWNARYSENDGVYKFLIIAEFIVKEKPRNYREKPFQVKRFVAIKYRLPVETAYTHVFDEYGNETTNSDRYFTLYRKSQEKEIDLDFFCTVEPPERYFYGTYTTNENIAYMEIAWNHNSQ